MNRRIGVALVAMLSLALFAIALPSMSGAQDTSATPEPAVAREVLGQIDSSIAPDRTLILAQRIFPAGSDSGFHPAPGPVVLYVAYGTLTYSVSEGVALYTASGSTQSQPVGPGASITVSAGDSVTYDQGVVHDVKNTGTEEAMTLESRLNPIATPAPAATPAP